MSDTTGKEETRPAGPRPPGPYWEDAAFRYVSRGHRQAMDAGDDPEAERFDALMQQFVNEALPDELYWQLKAEAKAERDQLRHERKQQPKPHAAHASAHEQVPPVNVADLKKRIFNPNVSRDNVIKALEALPPAERKSTIAGLPPGLRRKLGDYLKDGRR